MKELVLQDIVLNQVRRDKTKIKIKLVNGETVVGTIRGFDAETIILDTDTTQTMIYKSNTLFVCTPVPVLKDQPVT